MEKIKKTVGRPKERDTKQCSLYLTQDILDLVNNTVLPALKTDPQYSKINFTKYIEMLIKDDIEKNIGVYESALKPIQRK